MTHPPSADPTAGRRARRRGRAVVVGVAAAALLLGACTSSKSAKTTSTTTAGSTAAGATSRVTFTYKKLDSGGSITEGAIKNGSVDVGELYSVNGAIAANGWVVLTDDKHLQAADNFVPAVRTKAVTPEMSAVLDAVGAKMTQSDIQELVKEVSVDGQNPDDVAKSWLKKAGLPGSLKATGSFKVGTADFAESEIVGQIYAAALTDAGATVTVRSNIGERKAYIPLLENGDIDVIPEFTASLLVFLDAKATPSGDLAATYAAAKTAAASNGITLLKATDVSDVNVFVVTKKTSDTYDLHTLSDLAKVTKPLRFGVAPTCDTNAQCIPGLEKTYGLKFAAG